MECMQPQNDGDSVRRALQRLIHDLEAARAFSASVLENAAEGILVVDENGWISFANPAISRLLNATVQELQGVELLRFIQSPPLTIWRETAFYRAYLNHETYRVHDAVLRTAPGQLVPVALSCAPLSGEQRAMVVTILDMSVVRNLHQQLEYQAVTDPLTGLLNRRGFYQTAENSLLRNERSDSVQALLYLDLDGFKRINDCHGHDAGDRVLRWVAEQLKECLRPFDTVARMGGDEFTVLLDSLEYPEQAANFAQKLIERVSVCRQIDGLDVSLGVSIGIATYPECSATLEGLLHAADIAMYAAKQAGRQQYRFYDQDLNGRARSRLMLESSVCNAIENREFTMVYQPQVALEDGHLRGFEALLRWQHPSVGDVSPGLFIPLLEEARLINRLSSWVYYEAAIQRKAWKGRFAPDLVLSVSLSKAQFTLPNLVSQLQHVIACNELQPWQLEVEVAEAVLMLDPEEASTQLQRLHELGVRIALDDFGAANCSLTLLRDLPIDTLKLGQNLIARVTQSRRDDTLVRSIIDLCRQYEVAVIAEGVDTSKQARWLRDSGCEFVQGSLVAQPMMAEDVDRFATRFDWGAL